jgi:hypothetical protein
VAGDSYRNAQARIPSVQLGIGLTHGLTKYLTTRLLLKLLLDFVSLLLREQLVCDIIFIDIRDVGDGFHSNPSCGNYFHVVDPDVGIESFLFGFHAKCLNSSRTRVIGGERKQKLVGVRLGSLAKYFPP